MDSQSQVACSRPSWWLMIPVLLVVTFLGVLYINANPLWGNERLTVDSSGGVFSEIHTIPFIWNDVGTYHVQHLPSYMIFLSFWIHGSGPEPAAMRVLSLMIGLIGVALVYRIGQIVAPSTRAGLYAAAILGTSMLMNHFMIKLRMYDQLVTVTAFLILMYLSIVTARRAPARRYWVGLALGTTLLLYTHYLGYLSLLALGILHLSLLPAARRSWMRRWWGVGLAVAVGAVGFLPWLPFLINGVKTEVAERPNGGLNTLSALNLFVFTFGNGFPLIALPAVATVLFARGRRLRPIMILAAATVLLTLAYFAVSDRLTRGHTSYLIGVWPVLIVLIAAAIAGLEQRGGLRRLAGLAVLLLLVGSGIYAIFSRDMSQLIDSFRYLFPVHTVEVALRDDDLRGERVVVAFPDGLSENEYHFSRESIEDQRVDMKFADYVPYGGPSEGIVTRLEDDGAFEFSRWDRLWVAFESGRPSTARANFGAAVADDFQQCPVSLDFAPVRVDQYAQELTCCVGNHDPAIARFGDGIALLARRLPDEPAGAHTVDLTLLWSVGADVPPKTYSSSVQLFNAAGDKVGQVDWALKSTGHPCQQSQLEVGALEPGTYTASITVYDWHDGQRLPGALAGAATPGTDLLPIGTLAVS